MSCTLLDMVISSINTAVTNGLGLANTLMVHLLHTLLLFSQVTVKDTFKPVTTFKIELFREAQTNLWSCF